MLEELVGVARLVLDVDQRLQPHRAQPLRFLALARAVVVLLVEPVRGDAFLGHGVHGLGADLELHGGAERADERGVQRLVAVRFRDRDVVLEAAGHRLVELMQHAHRHVALGQRADDDAKAEDVVDLREAQALLAHLGVDRIERLLAAEDLRLQLRLRERLLDVLLDPLDDVAPVAARFQHRLRQRRLAPRLQVLERQLLQLAVGLVEAESMRDRRVDLERFGGDAAALGTLDGVERAHVVQPVGELDEDDADVARHRQQHLAKRLGLRFLARRKAQLVELGEAVDQVGGRCTEALDQLGLGDAAVFHRVVHQRGHDRLRVELPFGAQAGDGDRMRDVRLARGAELAEVRFVGEAVGVAHAPDVGGVEVVELDGEGGERRGGGIGRRGGQRRGRARRSFSRRRLGVGESVGRARGHVRI